ESGKVVAEEKLSYLKGKKKDDILRGQMTGQILWGGVRKAARLSLIKSSNIRYSKHKVGEEALYSFLLLYYARTFSFIEGAVYNYEVHSDSLSQTMQEDPWGSVALALRKTIKEMGCYEFYADTLNSFIYTAGIVALSKMAKIYPYREYKLKARSKEKDISNCIDKKYAVDKIHMDKKARILMPFFSAKLFWVIYIISKLR
ncbi:MAG: hypothetical protein PUJ24_10825, partial [Bacteroidales bacterium]|nr:hypothetical protein [Bacteroidales bacterium]